MESEKNTPPLHSYPNADRRIGEEEGPVPAQAKPLVHIADALKARSGTEDAGDIKTIRTYQGDVASAVRNDNVSVIKIALAEKKRQERGGSTEEIKSESKKGLIIGIVSGGLVIIGLTAIFFGYAAGQIFNTAPVDTGTSTSQNIIFFKTESETNIDITGADQNSIRNLVRSEEQKNAPPGSIESIHFVQTVGSTTENVPTADLLAKLRASAPDTLLRTLSHDYLFGIYAYDTPRDSFLLMNVDSYDQAYAGMISWEPMLKSTFEGILMNPSSTALPNNANAAGAGTTSATAQPNNTSISGDSFVDRVIDNRDTRVMIDGQGNTEMIYTFLDPHTLLIVSSEAALKEVSARLTTGQIVR